MIIAVDLEGMLSNHTDRLARLKAATTVDPRAPDAWKIYYKGLPDDEPREQVVLAVRKWIADGHKVIVYSTRFANKYNHEEEWLRGHELWEHIELLQRSNKERTIPGPQLVAIWASELKPDILADDRDEVRSLVSACCPKVLVLELADFDPEPA
jgi:hypothetical protein